MIGNGRRERCGVESGGGGLHVLAGRFEKLLSRDGRVPYAVWSEFWKWLDEHSQWRNAFCHGFWFGFSGDGASVLSHYVTKDKQVMRSPPMVARMDLAELRGRVVDATIRVYETASVAGSGSAAATVFRRQYEPRNSPPEPKWRTALGGLAGGVSLVWR